MREVVTREEMREAVTREEMRVIEMRR